MNKEFRNKLWKEVLYAGALYAALKVLGYAFKPK